MKRNTHIPCIGGPFHGQTRHRKGFAGDGSYERGSCSAGEYWIDMTNGDDLVYSYYLTKTPTE